ncbi:MAG: hypothetical protein P8N49_09970 [Opitutales bacterium]|nr:hypothetical protein [Opitutales bacterium]
MNSFCLSCLLLGLLFFSTPRLGFAQGNQISELKGSISVHLEGGSPERPFFLVSSSSLKGDAVFRGQVKQTTDNNISFYEVPNLLDPDEMQPPFKPGVLSTIQARAKVEVELDGTLSSLTLTYPGGNYKTIPDVIIDLPTSGSGLVGNSRIAEIEALIDTSAQQVSALVFKDNGTGYVSRPSVKIEGGAHFIKIVEESSMFTGKFFKITSNDHSSVIVENLLGINLAQVFKPNQLIEIYQAWTLGSLFGHTSEEVSLAEGNKTTADLIYILKTDGNQDGSNADFSCFYHDGEIWRSDENPALTNSADTVIIHPDQAFIIARRSPSPLDLVFSGSAATRDTFGNFPAHLKRQLLSNPYGVDIMLSDLISAHNITTNPLDTVRWFAHNSQEQADNVKILNDNVWHTYWNDGTNSGIVNTATATARFGTGIGGGITQQDISFSSGIITAMTNPESSNIVVTSHDHGLKNGLSVFINQASGLKTNANKVQIDENGNLVSQGAIPLAIQSAANGYHEIQVLDDHTFELIGKYGNSDFISDGLASWSTGSGGSGYSSDAFVSFIGGGGSGAVGTARVVGGEVASILVTNAGAGYVRAPKVFIHSGGWKKLGAGNTPFNDALIPASSGIMLVRNHSGGVRTLFSIDSPFN